MIIIFSLIASLATAAAPSPDFFGMASASHLTGERVDGGFEFRAGTDAVWVGPLSGAISPDRDGGIVVRGEYLPRIRPGRWGYPDGLVAGQVAGRLILFQRSGVLREPDECLTEYDRFASATETVPAMPSNLARFVARGLSDFGLFLFLPARVAALTPEIRDLDLSLARDSESWTIRGIGVRKGEGEAPPRLAHIFIEIRFRPSRPASEAVTRDLRRSDEGLFIDRTLGDRELRLEFAGATPTDAAIAGFLAWAEASL